MFSFTPPGGGVAVHGEGHALELTTIAVNDQPGTTSDLTVTETASSPEDPNAARTWSTQLGKFPQQFSLSDLTASPVEVQAPGRTTLKWAASAGDYTLTRSDQPETPPWPVGLVGDEVIDDLRTSPSVTFTLDGAVAVPNQGSLTVQRQVTVGVWPPPLQIGGFSASYEDVPGKGPQVTIKWDVPEADDLVISALGPGVQKAANSVTIRVSESAPLPTQITLTAANGALERTLRVQFSEVATSKDGGLIMACDGSRLYAGDGVGNRLVVLDALTLEVLGAPGRRRAGSGRFPSRSRSRRTAASSSPPASMGPSRHCRPATIAASRWIARPRIPIDAPGPISVDVSRDGRFAYVMSSDSRLSVVELAGGSVAAFAAGLPGQNVVVAPDGSILLFGPQGGDDPWTVERLDPAPPYSAAATWTSDQMSAWLLPAAAGLSAYVRTDAQTIVRVSLDTLKPLGDVTGVVGARRSPSHPTAPASTWRP